MKTLLAGALALALLPAAATAQSTDRFAAYADNASAPCRRWATVTPSDTTDLAEVPKAVFVGTGGNVAMIGVDAATGATGVTWKNIPSAAIIPARPRRVLATGTTAADIVACY